MVMVSHQYSDALLFADHIVVLADGHVRQRGTHLDLHQNPASSYIAEMVRVNRFEGTVTALDPGSRGCRVALRWATERQSEFEATAGASRGADSFGPLTGATRETARPMGSRGADLPTSVRKGQYGAAVRLIVARCEVTYTGRLHAFLPASTRLLMIKADGSVLVHADAGGLSR